MEKVKRVWATLSDEETALIEQAAKKERRSRASFLAVSALERAVEVLGKAGDV